MEEDCIEVWLDLAGVTWGRIHLCCVLNPKEIIQGFFRLCKLLVFGKICKWVLRFLGYASAIFFFFWLHRVQTIYLGCIYLKFSHSKRKKGYIYPSTFENSLYLTSDILLKQNTFIVSKPITYAPYSNNCLLWHHMA